MRSILDTGPWVALIDRSEANHERCVTNIATFDRKHFNIYRVKGMPYIILP